MASRKDYIATAAVLNANVAPVELVLDFADMFEEDNSRFDRRRFVDAATLNLQARLDATRHSIECG